MLVKQIKSLALFVLFLSVLGVSGLKAQYYGPCKVMLKSGTVQVLKAEKELNIEYDYTQMKVGAFNTEQEYINKKVTEYNEKEPGKGDKWKKGWVEARANRYEPKFEELFNKVLSTVNTSKNNSQAKFTLVVKTTFTEPGFNAGVVKKPSFVNFEFYIVETANKKNVVAELYLNNVPGVQAMGFDYDAGTRLSESYAKAGKMLAAFIVKSNK